ncbi:WD40 repeat domain-containing protein [Bradyrhizobium sp. 21]|nr:WD40 repeat domain-containing protein [Bradyrhizobium sp. 21]
MIAYSARGDIAVTRDYKGHTKLWDGASGPLLRTQENAPEGSSLIALSPDGRLAVSGAFDGTLTIWDVASGRTEQILKRSSPSQYAISAAVAFDADSRSLLVVDDEKFRVWDVQSATPVRTLARPEINARRAARGDLTRGAAVKRRV